MKLHTHCFTWRRTTYRESREIYKQLENIMDAADYWPDETKAAINTLITDLETKRGTEKFLEYFSIADTTQLTEADIRQYVQLYPSYDPDHISAILHSLFNERSDTDLDKRLAADSKIHHLLAYLNKRREILSKTKQELRFATERQELPTPAHEAWEKTKGIAGGFVDGFNASSGKEKLVMIGGAVLSFMLLKKILDKSKKIKFAAGMALGTGGLIAAIGMMNRMVEKSTGKPIFNTEGGPMLPYLTETQEQWDAQKHERDLQHEWERLRKTGIPVDIITSVVDEDPEKRKYAFGITNVCALNMKELKELYIKYKNIKAIPKSDMPHFAYQEDHLTATERFILIEDIAGELNCLKGDNWVWNNPRLQDKSVLTAILTTL